MNNVLITTAFIVFLACEMHVPIAAASEAETTNYLEILEYTVPAGRALGDAIAEGKTWAKFLRTTKDFKSVRLFVHSHGPEPSIYLIVGPNDWQSIETGFGKLMEEFDLFEKPFNWSGHSDNILSEIEVK